MLSIATALTFVLGMEGIILMSLLGSKSEKKNKQFFAIFMWGIITFFLIGLTTSPLAKNNTSAIFLGITMSSFMSFMYFYVEAQKDN